MRYYSYTRQATVPAKPVGHSAARPVDADDPVAAATAAAAEHHEEAVEILICFAATAFFFFTPIDSIFINRTRSFSVGICAD